ncbi:tyrosine--tRNA ligase [Candidatus Saccharibacteria bacterium]|nr:tyrosine--tRNA ligase [Candidatus Saccharibacteria bacterium]
MKLSEELLWRGFCAETTIKNPSDLDSRESKKFYWGADPSADSLTIGNLAALMMCACFVRHGYEPTLLVGGATGQIGDPKENGERDLKSLEEVEHNKKCIRAQVKRIIDSENVTLVDNLDWFKDINYLSFLREIGKSFSMTQLLDRQFVQNRIGSGGSGISYAEFSYTLIQGYDFLHLYRDRGISLQLCGADQYGNCTSGIHLIKRLENADADVWSTPLVIDPVTGRKFGKSEGNAIWLAASDNGSGNFTSIFDFYQFWLNQPDTSVEYLLKIYTLLDKPELEEILKKHAEAPELRLAQKALAKGATEVVHGEVATARVIEMTEKLFDRSFQVSDKDLESFADLLPTAPLGVNIVDDLVSTGLASSKAEARKFIKAGAVSLNGEKVLEETRVVNAPALLKKGKNKFALVR